MCQAIPPRPNHTHPFNILPFTALHGQLRFELVDESYNHTRYGQLQGEHPQSLGLTLPRLPPPTEAQAYVSWAVIEKPISTVAKGAVCAA